MKRQILFVDDEPNLLEGLKRMLRPMRNEWDMEFALGGKAALDEIEKRCFDVVVTDMRMPQIDGAMLLEEVHKRCPYSVRIVLSGQADHEATMRVVKTSHQFLSKPCNADNIRASISNACEIRDLLGGQEVKEFVSGITEIPVLEKHHVALEQLFSSDDGNMQAIQEIASKDVALTAKLLQLVNSSYFGHAGRVYSVTAATDLLGFDVLKQLFTSQALFTKVSLDPAILSLASVSEHSQRVAATARALAEHEGLDETLIEQAYTAGLLHELGRVLFATVFPDRYREVQRLVKEQQMNLAAAEYEVFGANQAETGAYLLALWNVPEELVEAVAFHCYPHRRPHGEFTALSAVHVANVLEDELRPMPRYVSDTQLDNDYLKQIQKEDAVEIWRDKLREDHS